MYDAPHRVMSVSELMDTDGNIINDKVKVNACIGVYVQAM